MGDQMILDDYNRLRDGTVSLLQEGKGRAQQAVEEETLRTYHEIGRLIDEYLLEYRERAVYGEQTVVRLARDVGLSKTLVYQMLGFYRLTPTFHIRGKLTWTHYRTLLYLPTAAEQRFYEEETFRNGWTVRELEAQVKSEAFALAQKREEEAGRVADRAGRKSLPALRGQLYTYRLVEASHIAEEPDLRLDLGFGIHLAWPFGEGADLRAGTLVSARQDGSGGYRFSEVERRQAAFYSYRARVVDAIDGDTVWLDIDCGFRVWTRQKVRLRGIDTPELPTAEGRRAKDFVARALEGLKAVAVTTTKPDKYDRYLADLFYLREADGPEAVLREGTFLNRALLEAGLAERFSEGEEGAGAG